MMDAPHLQGAVAHLKSSLKRKRSTHPIYTPEGGISQPSIRAVVESTPDPSNGLQAEVPSELETYLKKSTIPRTDTLDILSWWKSNSVEYPTLSRMARDVLAVPASTVASESAFSIGRRIVSDFRSRLTPKNVEALICLQDWIRASGSSEFHMEGIEDFIELPDQHQ